MYIYSERPELLRGDGARRTKGVDWLPVTFSRSHVPSATARQVFNVVLHSGHFQSRPGERLERGVTWGHEFFYCLKGSGYVRSQGKSFRVNPFELAWLSGLSACWADQAPWEVLWMRVDGHQVEQARTVLSALEKPVFAGLPREETRRVFHRVNHLLGGGYSPEDAVLNREVAELLGYLVESRATGRTWSRADWKADSPAVIFALEQMCGDLKRPWRVGELAKLCGLSERHFFRQFKRETGVSPIDWLRRERIWLAQGKLLDGAKRVKEVSHEVGYHDVFFFSRDFKRHTGACPSQYRQEHSSLTKLKRARLSSSLQYSDR